MKMEVVEGDAMDRQVEETCGRHKPLMVGIMME